MKKVVELMANNTCQACSLREANQTYNRYIFVVFINFLLEALFRNNLAVFQVVSDCHYGIIKLDSFARKEISLEPPATIVCLFIAGAWNRVELG